MTPQSASRTQALSRDPTLVSAALISILTASAYYLTAKIGFAFSLQPGSVSTLWMPNAILLIGLLLTRRRWWWVVIAVAFPAHIGSEFFSGVPMPMVLSWFVSNSFQALFGAYLIRYLLKSEPRFDRLRDVWIFLIFGVFLAPFLASFLDSFLVKLNGRGDGLFWSLWRIRFLSNVVATLTLVPFVIVWTKGGLAALKKAPLRRYIEAACLAAFLVTVGLLVFNSEQGAEYTPSLLYWPLPALLWATVRFGPRGITTAVLVVMFLAVVGATAGTGPFVTSSAWKNALEIQGFLITASIPLIVLAAVMEERKRAEGIALDNEERLFIALNSAEMDTWEWYIKDDKIFWAEATKKSFGLSSSEENITFESFLNLVHPDDREHVQQKIMQAINEGTPYENEFRIFQYGSERWFLSKGRVFYDRFGKPMRMIGVGMDITKQKQVEVSLSETNARNEAILRALPDMMFLQTIDGIYLDYYARNPSDLATSPDYFLGKNIQDVLPTDLAHRVLQAFSRLEQGEQPQVLEYSLNLHNEERHFEARMVLAEGQHVLSIVRDVTEERRAIEAVKESEEKLLQNTRHMRALAARLINAQESERRRIAMLLHDDVSQNLAALGLTVSRLKRKLPNPELVMFSELEELGEQIQSLTAQIRGLSHQLHPDVLEHLGLVAALETYALEFGEAEKIKTNFLSEVYDGIPFDLSVCFYRIALEALRNVARHSGARSAQIELREADGFLTLEVSDSGKGFEVEKARRGSGLGLASSEERVRLLHGTLEIKSDFHSGTTLTARVPLVRS